MVDFDELTEEQMDDLTQQVLDLYTTISEEALSINANCYEDERFLHKDFRTAEEIQEQEQSAFREERNQLLIEADIEINKLDDLGKDSSA